MSKTGERGNPRPRPAKPRSPSPPESKRTPSARSPPTPKTSRRSPASSRACAPRTGSPKRPPSPNDSRTPPGGAALWIAQLLRQDSKRQFDLWRANDVNQLLFRDIHHRVKNNLQSVQSLVRMQTIPADVKDDLQRRIAAMTAVHEHIYRLDQYVEVDAKLLIPAIVEPLIRASGQDIAVSFDIDAVEVERDSATPLALLVNELVTNALKYAFPEGKAGHIKLALKVEESNRARLTVEDDGVGFDPAASVSGMGSRLIKAMVMQMGGTYSYEAKDGTIFHAELSIRSPRHPVTEAARAAAAE